MKTQMRTMAGALVALAVGVAAASAFASEPAATGSAKSGPHASATHALVRDAETTVQAFARADPGLTRFFDTAVGWAVFPSVGKGGAGVGGAYGRGVLFEHGQPTGRSTLTQVTIGAQLGGQAYSEIVFFESSDALASFKKGQLAMAAQVSAVLASSGASANAKYTQGVAVFTIPKGGLMAEASVGGQKFGFRPFAKAM
jgi:lipid-binding SYLF domain-containing protein